MATITKGKTFAADETVTNTKLHTLVDSATVSAIVNADIDASAAIAGSKLNLASPGAIGGTTPAAGAFTTLSASSTLAVTGATTLTAEAALNGGATVAANYGIMLVEGTAPATAASEMAIYTKDTSGQPELFCREESSGDEVQITSGGALNTTGSILQVVHTTSSTYENTSSGTPNIPRDTTTPQLSETTILSSLDTAITPTSASSELLIRVCISFGSVGAGSYAACLFNTDSHATNALAMACTRHDGTDTYDCVTFEFKETAPNGTSETTYRIGMAQLGGDNDAYINGDNGAAEFAVNNPTVTIMEISA